MMEMAVMGIKGIQDGQLGGDGTRIYGHPPQATVCCLCKGYLAFYSESTRHLEGRDR